MQVKTHYTPCMPLARLQGVPFGRKPPGMADADGKARVQRAAQKEAGCLLFALFLSIWRNMRITAIAPYGLWA